MSKKRVTKIAVEWISDMECYRVFPIGREYHTCAYTTDLRITMEWAKRKGYYYIGIIG